MSLILLNSQRLMVLSASISILVFKNSDCHFSSTLMAFSISSIAVLGDCLKIVRMLILLRTFWQISLEIASIMSWKSSFWKWMCLEMVQISLRPFSREGRVSSIDLRSPLLMFLNWRSRVSRNFTKSFATACSFLKSFSFDLKVSTL